MSTQFKLGDVVQLVSGGPKMTVVDTVSEDEGEAIVCQWFDENELKTGTFTPKSIKVVDPD